MITHTPLFILTILVVQGGDIFSIAHEPIQNKNYRNYSMLFEKLSKKGL